MLSSLVREIRIYLWKIGSLPAPGCGDSQSPWPGCWGPSCCGDHVGGGGRLCHPSLPSQLQTKLGAEVPPALEAGEGKQPGPACCCLRMVEVAVRMVGEAGAVATSLCGISYLSP